MKKILGLDLGTNSIGWALVEELEDVPAKIIDMGTRIIPLSTDDSNEFSRGNSISKNQKRTQRRTQRKGYDRFQLRKTALTLFLKKYNIYPGNDLFNLNSLDLWGLRAKAVTEEVTPVELGRIFYHLNQKRGYKSSRSDANLDKKDTAYVAEVKGRHHKIKEEGLTIGQYFFDELKRNQFYRTKEQVFPREAYIDEFEAICRVQQKRHSFLTDDVIKTLRNEIIYYQRRLKSQKGLVSICEFEGFYTKNQKGKEIFTGPKVAPRSSPLFQVCKIWENVNNITIKNKRGDTYKIPDEKREELFNYLDNNKELSFANLLKILGLKKDDGWYGNKQLVKGLKGNITKSALQEHLTGFDSPLIFKLSTYSTGKEAYLYDMKTGEILESCEQKVIENTFEQQPLYQLWHVIYSIDDMSECSSTLQKKFNLPVEVADKLAYLDFKKSGFGNKSSRSMRKIIPYLSEGYVYSEACTMAGYNHSSSYTKEENLKRPLRTRIANLPKNSLRQPIVEKILNQMINLVNTIIEKHGSLHEIRVELARELKQSREERNEAFAAMGQRERENKIIVERLEKEYGPLGVRATRNNIIKWRLFHEIKNDEGLVNATCIYCGQHFGITEALLGNAIDVEHIIPRSRLFDDSQSNKTLSHRKCNTDKGSLTAFDFMKSKGEGAERVYIETVESLYKRGVIRKSKRDKLLMTSDKIPQDFIERQMRETQYISRKAKEILEQVCYNVWSTSGSVTAHLRNLWGWNDVLINLQLPKYKALGRTAFVEWETNDGQKHHREVIQGWTKRNDHRHHAIDALTIACTKQGFIQRINTLSSDTTKNILYEDVSKAGLELKERLSLLDKYLIGKRPFLTSDIEKAASAILISFKPGKKVATISKYKAKGKNLIKGVVVPRGPLSEDFIYGKIKTHDYKMHLKHIFENPHLILKPYIKSLVEARLQKFNGDSKKALASLKNEPIFLNKNNVPLQYATCFTDAIVKKYTVGVGQGMLFSGKEDEAKILKVIQDIVDKGIAQKIKNHFYDENGVFINPKEALKNFIWFNEEKRIPIKSVRCFTGLSAVEPINWDEAGNPIGYVKPGNNHHVAIYKDINGKLQEHVCTFWHAVERKKYGIPVIIKDPRTVWDQIVTNEECTQEFLSKLPSDTWIYQESLQQNEMFLIGLTDDLRDKAIAEDNKALLSLFTYRVQSISECDYWFRHHLETENHKTAEAGQAQCFHRFKSISTFMQKSPVKIRLDVLGNITQAGSSAINIPPNVKEELEKAARDIIARAEIQ
ncbi:MAG: type II CRISPR RNA-guided endonuclease Cas9 [Bacteroidota bacterium]|nr:type II CRISPR RNA-guided endonuclease Cas9 [Bacteroidota bacterium]